jgi:hypothetical protein
VEDFFYVCIGYVNLKCGAISVFNNRQGANILSQYYIIVKVVEIHDWEIIQDDAIIQRYKSLALHLPWPPALA